MIRLRVLVAIFVVVTLAASGCDTFSFISQKEKDKADIKAALEKYLNERGTINLSAMTWEIKEFSQDRDRATVQVLFTAKQGGMQMPVTYELRKQNGTWQVQKSGGSTHPGAAQQPGMEMPPTAPSGQLPAGHPAVAGAPSEPATKASEKTPPPKKP